jgi:hypothetical protein
MEGLFARGQIEAKLQFTVLDWGLSDDKCISLYSVVDTYENGIIEIADKNTEDLIGEMCGNFNPGDTIILDVTLAVEHDLFDPDQTRFLGFVIDRSTPWLDSIQFYDHTDLYSGPRLIVTDSDSDADDIPAVQDNCPYVYNPNQEDSFPPGGNGCGDACECHADCNSNQKVDLSDLVIMKQEFLRTDCATNPCDADCNYDNSVDLADLVMMKEEFLRSDCPICQ